MRIFASLIFIAFIILGCNSVDKLDYTMGDEIEMVQSMECETLDEQFSYLDLNDEHSLYLLALKELNCGDIDLAIELLEKSISLNSNDVYKLYCLAEFLLYNYEISDAYNEIVKAELILPSNYYILILKAVILYFGGLIKESLNTLQFIEKRDSTKSDIYRIRHLIFRSQDNFKDSYESINTAINKDPENPYLYYNAADLLITVKKYDETILYIDKCIELDKSESEYYLLRGFAYYHSGNIENSEKDWKVSLDFGNERA